MNRFELRDEGALSYGELAAKRAGEAEKPSPQYLLTLVTEEGERHLNVTALVTALVSGDHDMSACDVVDDIVFQVTEVLANRPLSRGFGVKL